MKADLIYEQDSMMETETEGRRAPVPLVNYLLIALNAGVFAAGLILENTGADASFLYRRGALYAPLILNGEDHYRLLTSIFLHVDAAHLVNNMIVQFAGGEIAERNLGHLRYGLLYLLAGIGGNVVSVLADRLSGNYGLSVGASGAVFGVTGALLYLILHAYLAKNGETAGALKSLILRAALMTVYLLYSGWENPSINQAAHVGGLVCGFLLTALFMRGRKEDLEPLLR